MNDSDAPLMKQQAWIPVSNSVLNDLGFDLPEEPLSPEFERWYRWHQRRRAIAEALVSPLWWLGRAGDGANWLGVELTNVLYRLLRVNARMVHDAPDPDEEEW